MKYNLFADTALAAAFSGCGFCLWDVGARGGVDPAFAPFAFAIDAAGFEPDPSAFAALSPSGQWRSEKFFETALGTSDAGAVLHITKDPAGTSFLTHDKTIGARYGLEDLFTVDRAVDVPTVTMDQAIARLGIPVPNLLKLDVDGAELDILKGGAETLKGVIAVKLEAAFIRHRVDQLLAGELIAFLEEHGLYPVDIVDAARWRKRPWAGDPYSVRRQPAYSRGRLAQADIIFLREPVTVTPETQRAAALAAIGLGYFDHGLELLAAGPAGEVRALQDAVYAASRTYGRARARQAMGKTMRKLTRLGRSLFGGLNVPPRSG